MISVLKVVEDLLALCTLFGNGLELSRCPKHEHRVEANSNMFDP
jgi:hypothetical protein